MTRRLLVAFLFTGSGPRAPGRVLLQQQRRGSGVVVSGFTHDYPVGSGKAASTVLSEALRNRYGIWVPGNLWELVADVWAVGLRADVFRYFNPNQPATPLPPDASWQDPDAWISPFKNREAAAETLPLMLATCLTENYAYPIVMTKRERNDRVRGPRTHPDPGEPAGQQHDRRG